MGQPGSSVLARPPVLQVDTIADLRRLTPADLTARTLVRVAGGGVDRDQPADSPRVATGDNLVR
ncbi:hypothetical protein ACQSSU_16390 [Micromonospora echinospora]